MTVVDSSFLISLLILEDENHEAALELAAKSMGIFEIIDTVLFETITVINYKFGLTEANRLFKEISENNQFKISFIAESDRLEILHEFMKLNGKISPIDFSVVYFAKKQKSKFLTFDKEQERQFHKL